MSHRVTVLGLAMLLGVAGSATLADRAHDAIVSPPSPSERLLLNDPPRAHLNAPAHRVPADTAWFGGEDPATGLAVPGGIWDFDDGTLQGWRSEDLTDSPAHFRHVTADSCVAHGSSDCPLISVGGSTGSVWCGVYRDEADAMCWPGGQGYGNDWGDGFVRIFDYGGTGSVTLSYDYFVETEAFFDVVYVYVIDNNGILSGPFNTSANPNENGFGYSGTIGSPSAPAGENLVIDATFLPDGPGFFEILLSFASDAIVSDEGDGSFGGFLGNTQYGAFGLDDVLVTGVALNDLSDFEPTGVPGEELDDWVAFASDPIGSFLSVQSLDDLDPITDPCDCPLAGNVMVAADVSQFPPNFPHPKGQEERLISNPAYVGPGAPGHGTTRVVEWGVWEETPLSNGVGYRVGVHYYPWTCPATGIAGWTLEPAGPGGYFFSGSDPRCDTFLENLSVHLPASVDSLAVVFEILSDCDRFGVPPNECTGPEQTNTSPYWDTIRLGLVETANAPILAADLLYQDAFPSQNSLLPTATAFMYAYYDNNRSDGDVSNANMGDSVVVIAGGQDNTHVYLNYHAYPGVGMGPDGNNSLGDPFFSECGDANAVGVPDNWAVARMDTAETAGGLHSSTFATYHLEGSCGFIPPEKVPGPGGVMVFNPGNKILPDDLFVPGTTVEYFFSSSFGPIDEALDVGVHPDTTGGFYLEVEVLPGYLTQTDQNPLENLIVPNVLYVDAYNRGAQRAIEDWGLRPYLGQAVDIDDTVHDLWDRYDYQAAGTNVCAPMARESSGDNGMTRYQSLVYRKVLYNTGTFTSEGLRDGDADLLQNWLITNDFGRWDLDVGLWLSGNGIATILWNPNRPNSQVLLQSYAGATPVGVMDDESICTRLDPTIPRLFPASGASYGSVRGGGCPGQTTFQVLDTRGDGYENLEYVDQDGGETPLGIASISNGQYAPVSPFNYGVVLDAWSLNLLRSTPDDWTGADCGTDSVAIFQRVFDVFTFLEGEIAVIDVEPTPPGASIARTFLFPNNPNPFNPQTTIRYDLAQRAHVTLEVFDTGGRKVRTLVDGEQTPQNYTIIWDGATDSGEQVASGVYWTRLQTSTGFAATRKMVMLK